MIIACIDAVQPCAGKAAINGVEVNAKGALEIILCEVKVKINLFSIRSIDSKSWTKIRKFVSFTHQGDVVPPCIGAED